MKMKQYIWNLLISLDQFFNALFGGYPDETISSRMGKCVKKNNCVFCGFICKVLDIFDKGHCEKSIEIDEGVIETKENAL
jgi:hypothetical protein